MSTSLVRKSLDIIERDSDDIKSGKKKANKKSKGVLHLIPSNHRINTKQGTKGVKIVVSNSKKTTIEEAKLKLYTKSDKTEKNIEKLLLLSGNCMDPETSDKLLNRALKKRYVPNDQKPVEQETTAFTEADFKQFEKDYYAE